MSSSPVRARIEEKLMQKVVDDPGFRDRLLADPRSMIAELLHEEGMDDAIPAGLDIKVVEETPDTAYLVLPPRKRETQELTAAELAQVAGGIAWTEYSSWQCMVSCSWESCFG